MDTLQKGSYWHVITRGKSVHDKVQIEEEIIPDGAKAKLGLNINPILDERIGFVILW